MVHVVGEANDPVFRVLDDPFQVEFSAGTCIPTGGRMLVYLGGFGPHKNVSALVQAFSTLAGKPDYGDICLVLVGEYHKEVFHSEISALQQQINQAGLGKRAIFTGYLPDEQVAVLLNRATVLVLPSLMEGYGLPAVEAAACGCPVIATRESPLPELLGEGGLYFDPADISELSHALQQVLDSQEKRETMKKKGLEAAGKLSWEISARQMIAILSSLEEKPVAV
jgi:glycosyltransferase involved in cell wall biosynthesis